ncbi:hypothetical protein [Thetidibacter halocola]|uniref:Uncharacterized protein n=1 Tax=Thetidibacter halocola TaxID=2827239 RepID=A0A8J8BB64_9RHOB|nr:hypothetical protein [Thetidibacter halocola]MBS0125913.1 hypothetical protein [Thetidibacter halocola]
MAKTRFTASILKTAARTTTALPWTRGKTRAARLAARKAQPDDRKRA